MLDLVSFVQFVWWSCGTFLLTTTTRGARAQIPCNASVIPGKYCPLGTGSVYGVPCNVGSYCTGITAAPREAQRAA